MLSSSASRTFDVPEAKLALLQHPCGYMHFYLRDNPVSWKNAVDFADESAVHYPSGKVMKTLQDTLPVHQQISHYYSNDSNANVEVVQNLIVLRVVCAMVQSHPLVLA